MNCFFLVGVKLACTNQGFLVFGEQQHFWTCPGYICTCDYLLGKVSSLVGFDMLMARNCNCNRALRFTGWRPKFDDRFYFWNVLMLKDIWMSLAWVCYYMSLIVCIGLFLLGVNCAVTWTATWENNLRLPRVCDVPFLNQSMLIWKLCLSWSLRIITLFRNLM